MFYRAPDASNVMGLALADLVRLNRKCIAHPCLSKALKSEKGVQFAEDTGLQPDLLSERAPLMALSRQGEEILPIEQTISKRYESFSWLSDW